MQRMPRSIDFAVPSVHVHMPSVPSMSALHLTLADIGLYWSSLSLLACGVVLAYVTVTRVLLGRRDKTEPTLTARVHTSELVADKSAVAGTDAGKLESEKQRIARSITWPSVSMVRLPVLVSAAAPPTLARKIETDDPLCHQRPHFPPLPKFSFDLSSKLLAILGDDEDFRAPQPSPAPGSPTWTIDGTQYRLPQRQTPLIKIGPPPSSRRMSISMSSSPMAPLQRQPGAWHPVRSAPPMASGTPTPPPPTRHRRTQSLTSALNLPRTSVQQISPTPPTLSSPAFTVAQMGGYAGFGQPMSMAKLIMGRYVSRSSIYASLHGAEIFFLSVGSQTARPAHL
jgi:hypothetical protein